MYCMNHTDVPVLETQGLLTVAMVDTTRPWEHTMLVLGTSIALGALLVVVVTAAIGARRAS